MCSSFVVVVVVVALLYDYFYFSFCFSFLDSQRINIHFYLGWRAFYVTHKHTQTNSYLYIYTNDFKAFLSILCVVRI